MISATVSAPAFKEWAIIVEALGQGQQILILRKGGIAEGKNGFGVYHSRFWLFPTQYHQQLEKTKPAAASFSRSFAEKKEKIALRYFAELESSHFLTYWEQIRSLDSFHLWNEATVRERFDYSKERGLHLLLARVFRLKAALLLLPDPSFEGCKSWIELPHDFASLPSEPVLSDEAFSTQQEAILTLLK